MAFEGTCTRSEATRVHDPPNKPSTRGKTEPLGSQKVGRESDNLG